MTDLANKPIWEKKKILYTPKEIHTLIFLFIDVLAKIIVAGVIVHAIVKIDYRLGWPLDVIDPGIVALISMFPLIVWAILPFREVNKILKK